MSASTDQNMNGSLPEGAAVWSQYKEALNAASEDTKGLEGRLKSLGSVVGAMGPQFADLGKAIEGGMNPALLVTMAAVAGMDKVFEHVQQLQNQFRSLVDEGERINGTIRNLINARPTATQAYIEKTDQLARLHEHPDRSHIEEAHLISSQRERDQSNADGAPEYQKPALKRKVITDEIALTQLTLEKDAAKGTDLDIAQEKVDETRDAEDDLKRQMEQLSGIIDALKANAAKAKAAGDSTGWVPFKGADYLVSTAQKEQAAALQAQLDKATAAFPAAAQAAADAENDFNNVRQNLGVIADLKERIITLNDTLSTFNSSRDGQKLETQIRGIIDQSQGTGDSLREMANKVNLSQQQMVDLATQIIAQQKTVQDKIKDLHDLLDAQAKQIAALPNSNR